MSFTSFEAQPLRSREQIALEVHQVSLARGLDELATVIALMTISVEVGANDRNGNRQWWCPANRRVPATFQFPHDSTSDDNRSSGYFQQQPGPNGEPWWGTPQDMMTLSRAANTFLERLADDYVKAANNPALAGQFAQRVQQSAYPDRYAAKWDEAWTVLRRALNSPTNPPPKPVGWRGDPVWLPDVLRDAGLVCHIYPGAFERGHGDMADIRGVLCHHTGSFGETPRGIAEHPSLGLASQLYLGKNGEYTLCGVGIAYHAGKGGGISWLPDNNANPHLIGIEAANDGGGSSTKPLVHRSSWPDVQYDAYVRGVAAINARLGVGADRAIGHKEWAGRAQGKWDPGQLDMNIFRADVAARLNSGGDDMAQVPQEQWDRVYRELTQRHRSRSPLRHLGEGEVDTWAGMDLNHDGNTHVLLVERLAVNYQDPQAIALLEEVAGADPVKFPDRQKDAELARRILAKIKADS